MSEPDDRPWWWDRYSSEREAEDHAQAVAEDMGAAMADPEEPR
jgi:hypothetical protein